MEAVASTAYMQLHHTYLFLSFFLFLTRISIPDLTGIFCTYINQSIKLKKMWIRLKTWKLFNPYCVDWKILPPVLFWFQLAQWFQRRRLKCNSLQMTKRLPTTDAKWWQYLTWHFGSGELKTVSKNQNIYYVCSILPRIIW